jgi:hypothetical protein
MLVHLPQAFAEAGPPHRCARRVRASRAPACRICRGPEHAAASRIGRHESAPTAAHRCGRTCGWSEYRARRAGRRHAANRVRLRSKACARSAPLSPGSEAASALTPGCAGRQSLRRLGHVARARGGLHSPGRDWPAFDFQRKNGSCWILYFRTAAGKPGNWRQSTGNPLICLRLPLRHKIQLAKGLCPEWPKTKTGSPDRIRTLELFSG